MGQTLPISDPGVTCPNCFGPGKTFGDVITPRYVIVTFKDIQPGPAYNGDSLEHLNVTVELIQDSGLPCTWGLNSASGSYLLFWSSGQALLQWHDGDGFPVFFSPVNPLCSVEFPGSLGPQPAQRYFGGTAEVRWIQDV